jgi:succinylglutamate desuccinylase
MQVREYTQIPDGLLDCDATQLYQKLDGPCLIHLNGRRERPLFVSVLLHGNEITGWEAIKQILIKYRAQALPRSLSIFIGNIHAARYGLRCLDKQPDFNRIWKVDSDSGESELVLQVLDSMRQRKPFACIDVHNNTGRNPHYACVNRLDVAWFQLARLFSRTIVYFLQPDSVLSIAFSAICPSVTVECGRPEDSAGVDHAREFIEAALHLEHFSEHAVSPRDIDVFHTVATVKVHEDVEVGFADSHVDLDFFNNLDEMNFRELLPGTRWAKVRHNCNTPVLVTGENGEDLTERFFNVEQGHLCIRVPVMPSMLTRNIDIIRRDCLCYLMERLDAHCYLGN